MESKRYLVTVLMTVFNGEKYLSETIKSILKQTYLNIEFLIVDDCSSDASLDIINSFDDDRIKLIKNRNNIGQTKSLNIGINKSNGEFIARVDQDDVCSIYRIEQEIEMMINGNFDLIGSNSDVINSNGLVMYQVKHPETNDEILDSIFFGCPFSHSSIMMRKKSLNHLGYYNETLGYAADWDLWVRFVLNGYKVFNIQSNLVKIRRHSGQGSSLKDNKIIIYKDHLAIIESLNFGPKKKHHAKYFNGFKLYTIFRLYILGQNNNLKNIGIKISLLSLQYFILHFFYDLLNALKKGRGNLYTNNKIPFPRIHQIN